MSLKNKLRIGAINWDAFVKDGAYFASYAMKSLANDKYSSRLPFYIKKKDGNYTVPERTLEEYEKELEYAIDSGLDFFAYCWYPDSFPEERSIWHDKECYTYLSEHYPELNYSRKLYQKSALNKKIGMCAILFCINAYAESDFEALFSAMKEDYYVKIDGKPLVIIFDSYDRNFIELVRERAKEKGLYLFVAFSDSYAKTAGADLSSADGITAYACGGKAESFDEFTSTVNEYNKKRAKCGVSVIPLMSLGWNPSPRIDHPVPWCPYEKAVYAGKPNEAEIDKAFAGLADFVNGCDKADTGCAIVFAWNEFEEGGYLCPTLKDDGGTDDTMIKAFAKAKKKYTD